MSNVSRYGGGYDHGGYGGRTRILRAMLVVEFDSGDLSVPSSALLVHQQGGNATLTWESEEIWDGERFVYPAMPRRRRHNVTIEGSGDVVWYHDADTLFNQWQGDPAPTPPKPLAIEPARPTLEEGS